VACAETLTRLLSEIEGAEGTEGAAEHRETEQRSVEETGGSTWSRGDAQKACTMAPGGEDQMAKGQVLLFGPEILKRAQPHGTFKFLFNGIMYGAVVRD
jgi:hypothetical protein